MLGNYTRITPISFKVKLEIPILVPCDLHSYAVQEQVMLLNTWHSINISTHKKNKTSLRMCESYHYWYLVVCKHFHHTDYQNYLDEIKTLQGL